MIQDRITQDLKKALLEGDKATATVLRGLKSAIGYAEVEQGSREQGLSDDEVIRVLQKEAKKRQDSADLYKKAGDEDRAAAELKEKEVIEKYLPEQLSEEEVVQQVDAVIAELGVTDQKAMGQVIGDVKARVGARADGAVIARIVKERLGK